MKLNRSARFGAKGIRKNVDFVDGREALSQFGNVPAVSTGSVIIVDNERNLQPRTAIRIG